MPIAHFKNPYTSPPTEIKGRRFSTPKRMDLPKAWVREARKAIPEIPSVNPRDDTGWEVYSFDPSLSIILIELVHQATARRVRLAISR